MSRIFARTLLGPVVLSLALVSGGQAQTGPGGFSELHRAAMADSTDSELVMGLIERESESTTSKHYHPGGEFGFVVEGVVYIEAEGKSGTVVRAGESFYQPPGEWHIISTDAEGAKTVVFRVLQHGQDPVVDVE